MPNPDSPVHFLRKKDYLFVKVLGQGACGQTVLLRDEVIGSDFVCKKYVPFSESHRQELFKSFLREIKLLHEVFHPNVIRVFNYYVYPESFSGYILMEYVDGSCIDDYVREKPETINDLFIQAIEGFAYLERASILHRDIRPQNLMVHEDGTLKIIDLGFGKRAESSADYDKSISLNWWCEKPQDFDSGTYSHSTEVYFVGKLFQELVLELQLEHFQHEPLLSRMCERNPSRRIESFSEIRTEIQIKRSSDIDFRWEEKNAYQQFANAMCGQVTKIEVSAKYADDPDHIRTQLEAVYRACMLEPNIPDCAAVIRIFIKGGYYYRKSGFPTEVLKGFLDLLRSAAPEKKRIAIANLHSRLDAATRYAVKAPFDDDIPF